MITLEQLQAGIVLPIDKPRQWTSFQAVNKIKAILRKRVAELQSDKVDSVSQPLSHSVTRPPKIKIGHAGTLDPLATGLLLVCLGKATKSIPQLQDGDKVYTGTLVLGATTPCYDLEQAVDHYYPYEHITRELLEQTVRQFTGTLMQVPPMFSAVKVDGQRAYEIARIKNEELKNKNDGPRAKPITIYNFEITDFRKGDSSSTIVPFTPPSLPIHSPLTPHLYDHPQGTVPPHLPQADFRIHCGKGTYIRSLARDLGLALGSGAFLSALRREQVGDYTVDHALTLDQVADFLAQ